MKKVVAPILKLCVIALIALTGTACVTYHQPRYGGDGVYFDQPRSRAQTVVISDPLLYPYWSLDYFYFSRFYHPYSVVVAHHDPWFYPYPGWYYGYRPGPRSSFAFSGGFYYPWYSFGFGYASYQPWRPHYVYYPVHAPQRPPAHRVRDIDERLRAIDARYREPQLAGPGERSRNLPVRSEAMTRHRIAEDRAAASSRRPAAATAPRASPQRRPESRPIATPRSRSSRTPSHQPTRAREPSRLQRPEPAPPPRSTSSPRAPESRPAPVRQSAPPPRRSSTPSERQVRERAPRRVDRER
ncbi:MAG: hypothetical protein EA419_03910 [Wenzhouxiangella sp.]|nr:MAG: hypothetical protein EA419_03910 [Wenzhouxiangella sp.]